MRYTPEAPLGVMDYLFTRMMLWGAAEGFRWFDLGMAPLAGLESTYRRAALEPGGRPGLPARRALLQLPGSAPYKEKFDPVWEPRYLAFPGALVLPQILVHLAALISGGVTAVFRR